ncbi:MAG: helix-turn-helix transcriptional regulator [Thermomicrobiales bacterium]
MTDGRGAAELIDADDVLAEQLTDPHIRTEWERLALARAVALRLVVYRADHGLTQTALGRILDMPQPAIARLESAEHAPSFATLVRLSEALDIAFLVDIRPRSLPDVSATDPARIAKIVEEAHTDRGADILVVAS